MIAVAELVIDGYSCESLDTGIPRQDGNAHTVRWQWRYRSEFFEKIEAAGTGCVHNEALDTTVVSCLWYGFKPLDTDTLAAQCLTQIVPQPFRSNQK